MILDLLLNILYYLLSAVLIIFPNYNGLPTQIISALDTVQIYLQKANSFLPMDTLMIILGLIFTFEAAILTFKLVNYVLNKVRGSG